MAPASFPPLTRACMLKKASLPMRIPIIGLEATVGGGVKQKLHPLALC